MATIRRAINPPTRRIIDRLGEFHNQLVLQAGAYQNGTWVVGVAKAGIEEGCELIGGTCIVAPSGVVVAQALTQGDELVVARCDLDEVPRLQGLDLQFRAPPRAGTLPDDCRAQGRQRAAVRRQTR